MQVLRQIRERGESAIIYDPACEYLQRFYDAERGDIILNPLDARCPYWGPSQEMGSNAEADAIAASLYQSATDVKDEFFNQTPAQIFAHLLRKGPTPHQLAEWMANSDTLEAQVAGTEMSFYIDRKAGTQRAGAQIYTNDAANLGQRLSTDVTKNTAVDVQNVQMEDTAKQHNQ